MKGKSLIVLALSSNLISCGSVLDTIVYLNKTDAEHYDKSSCENGAPSLPNEPRRTGCVNNISKEQNNEDFRRYKIERDIYLNEK